jgi:hypothetical protein
LCWVYNVFHPVDFCLYCANSFSTGSTISYCKIC